MLIYKDIISQFENDIELHKIEITKHEETIKFLQEKIKKIKEIGENKIIPNTENYYKRKKIFNIF